MHCTAETGYEGSPKGHASSGAFWSLLLPVLCLVTGVHDRSGEAAAGPFGGGQGVGD